MSDRLPAGAAVTGLEDLLDAEVGDALLDNPEALVHLSVAASFGDGELVVLRFPVRGQHHHAEVAQVTDQARLSLNW